MENVDDLEIYIIAMRDKNYERVKKTLTDIGLKPNMIHRYNAVRGSDQDIQSQFANIPSMLTPRAENQIKLGYGRESHSSLPGWGAVGCYLSHLNLWKLSQREDKTILIFEEDAWVENPDKSVGEELNNSYKEFMEKPDPHMLSFGWLFANKTTDIPNSKLKKLIGRIYGLQGYLMTPAGAEILISKAFPIEVQVDSYIGYMVENGLFKDSGYEILNIYMTKTNLIGQLNNDGTAIQTKGVTTEYFETVQRQNNILEFTVISICVVILCILLYRIYINNY